MRSFTILCAVAATLLFVLATADTEISGDARIHGTLQADNATGTFGFQVGTADAFNRRKLWFYSSNDADPANANGSYVGDGPVVHLGGVTADGFPVNIISEGVTCWGQNENGGAMNGSDWSLGRYKPSRFQIRQSIGGVQSDVFRVDPTKLTWRDKFILTEASLVLSNLLGLQGDGVHLLEVPQNDTAIHLTDYSVGRIPIKVNGETRYIPYFS